MLLDGLGAYSVAYVFNKSNRTARIKEMTTSVHQLLRPLNGLIIEKLWTPLNFFQHILMKPEV